MIKVAKTFSSILEHRRYKYHSCNVNSLYNGECFRRVFLEGYDNKHTWESKEVPLITFDFEGVIKISPSFANEAFAYFTKYAEYEDVLDVIQFVNITRVQMEIIKVEIMSGYAI